MARDGHGLPKVTPGPAKSDPSTTSSTLLDTSRCTPMGRSLAGFMGGRPIWEDWVDQVGHRLSDVVKVSGVRWGCGVRVSDGVEVEWDRGVEIKRGSGRGQWL
jgi:hypothetical protein